MTFLFIVLPPLILLAIIGLFFIIEAIKSVKAEGFSIHYDLADEDFGFLKPSKPRIVNRKLRSKRKE
ncbi:hypothetical protein AB990_08805 [Alkalihalobacillus pseudalcaliphilus]|nr:hypothetical protein AB990_08805 [Alkalihalobacillus pseudalcaliphilus]